MDSSSDSNAEDSLADFKAEAEEAQLAGPSVAGVPGTLAENGGADSMEQEVQVVVAEIRRVFGKLLESMPRKVKSAADVKKSLAIDNKLATQVFKIAKAENLVAAAVLVPGRPSFERLVAAAKEIGLDSGSLRAAEAALVKFEALVRRHAGNRTSFDSMLNGFSGPDTELLELQHRRAAFRAMGHILGVQAHLLTYCSILYDSDTGTSGLMTLRGFSKLRRIRSNTPVMLSTASLIGPGNPAMATRRPLDSTPAGGNAAGFIADCCPKPMPEVQTRQLPDGGSITEFVDGAVGDLHATDWAVGFDYPHFGLQFPGGVYDDLEFMGDVHVPAEELIHDVLVHKNMRRFRGTAQLFPNRGGIRPMYDSVRATPLPALVQLGVFENASVAFEQATPASHAAEVGWAFRERKQKLSEFVLYRCSVRYPVVNTIVRITLL